MSKTWRFLFCGIFLWTHSLAFAEFLEPVKPTEQEAEPPPASLKQPGTLEAPAPLEPSANATEPKPELKPEPKPESESPKEIAPVVVAEPPKIEVIGADRPLPEIKNIDEILKQLKVSKFKGKEFNREIKVAVLGNGWSGWKSEIGKSFPANTEFSMGPFIAADNNQNENLHGSMMAKIMAQIIEKSGAKAKYKLYLFNSFGFTKFKAAIQKIIEEKIDVVLYADVWENAGNGDGKGYLNTEVNKALQQAGVIWINAAGNYGIMTRKAAVDGKADGDSEYIVFKNSDGKTSDSAPIVCKADPGKTCNISMTLAWNDFKDDENEGTDKDLDLFLLSEDKKTIKASSVRKQYLKPPPGDRAASALPRELIETKLEPGTYHVRVLVKSKNFSASQDQLRLTLFGEGMTMKDASIGETILPPADNPGVITLGDRNVPETSTSKSMKKPDIFLTSLVKLDNGSSPYSTSNATAMAAAIAVLELGTGTEKTREAVLEKMKLISQKGKGVDVAAAPVEAVKGIPLGKPAADTSPLRKPSGPLAPRANPPRPYNFEKDYDANMNLLNAIPPNGECIISRSSSGLSPAAQRFLSKPGTALIGHRGRLLILVSESIYRSYIDTFRINEEERLFMEPSGVRKYDQQDLMDKVVSRGAIEILSTQTPICQRPVAPPFMSDEDSPNWEK